MTREEAQERLAELDRQLAEHDALDATDPGVRAAELAFERADLVEELDGEVAAIPLYSDVVDRLEGHADDEATVLRVAAMNTLAILLCGNGREEEGCEIAAALVERHLKDAPASSAREIVNGCLIHANGLERQGRVDAALALLDRAVSRYGQPDVEEHERSAVIVATSAGFILRRSGRLDEALERLRLATDEGEISVDEDPVLSTARAEALTCQADVLAALGRYDASEEVCVALVKRYADADQEGIVAAVDWARGFLGYRAGCRLRGYIGRGAEVEAACRRAVAAGAQSAWYELGIVLGMHGGREAEEEDALRRAIAASDASDAAAAAIALGGLLLNVRDDPRGAHAAFGLAVKAAEPRVAIGAFQGMAHSAIAQRDRPAAVAALAEAGRLGGRRFPEEVDELAPRVVRRIAPVVLSVPGQRLVRVKYRIRRSRQRFLASARWLRPLGAYLERRAVHAGQESR